MQGSLRIDPQRFTSVLRAAHFWFRLGEPGSLAEMAEVLRLCDTNPSIKKGIPAHLHSQVRPLAARPGHG
jgi:hypothetical protein